MCNALLMRVMIYISARWSTRAPQHNSQDETLFRWQRIFWWSLGHNGGENERNVSKNIVYKLSHQIHKWDITNLEKTG